MDAERERQVIALCQAGDRMAYAEVVEAFKRQAYYVAFGMMGNKEDSLDMVQEAFVKAYKNLRKFDTKYRFSTWFFRILVNTCISSLRKRREIPLGDQTDLQTGPMFSSSQNGSNPHAVLERKEAARTLRKALGKLKAHLREVVVLKDVQGFSYKEIAQITGVPIGTVMSRLNTARTQLREILAPSGVFSG